MSEPLLLPPESAPGKPVWRRWKWIFLSIFGAVLVLRPWLPGIVTFLGWLCGIAALTNLAFLGARHLKDRFFWRVRNRIVGSFVFVGLIPLVFLLGTLYLAGYLLLGQLGADYFERSVLEVQHDVAAMNREAAQRITAVDTVRLQPVVAAALQKQSGRFPRLAARVLFREGGGAFRQVWKHDPAALLPPEPEYPAEKWLSGSEGYDGILISKGGGWITSLQPLHRFPGYFLDISAPIDSNLEARLLDQKSIYALFAGVGKTNIRVTPMGTAIEIDPDLDAEARGEATPGGAGTESMQADPDAKRRRAEMEARRKQDRRWKITWAAVPSGRDFHTGESRAAAVAIIRVPFMVLFDAYLQGGQAIGGVVLRLIYVLFGLFLAAELVSLLIGAAISRRVTKSIDDMHKGILALQKGDLSHRIPTRRNDQLGLLAHAFNQMASSITRLLDEVSEKKRLEQELEIAREVQATLFPKQLPRPRGLSVYGGCEPAQVVSGDYYDFIIEDERHLDIVVGDVSGKGISAALLMANLQAAMRNQLLQMHRGRDPDFEKDLPELMSRLNRQIYDNSPSAKYVTLFLARYEAESRRLSYCNAGHLPPFVFQNGGVSRLETGGTVLGLFPTADFTAGSVELDPGSLVAIYTDGVTEAVNEREEEFGEGRLLAALEEVRQFPPEAVYRHVSEQVRQWQGNLKQHDDITLIVARAG